MDPEEYLYVQHGQTLLNVFQKFPPRDEETLTPAMRLLQKKRQAEIMQRVLEAERADFEIAMDGLALQWEELKTQKEELENYYQKFQPVIWENEQKRLGAVNRMMKQRDIYTWKERELKLLQEEYEELVKQRLKVQARIQRYRKFYQYLERVVEASAEFQEVSDVVSRFHTLVATSSYLQQGTQEAQAAIQEAKGQISRHLEDRNNLVLQLNNQLGQLQTSLEDAKNQSLLWESRWAHIQNTATKKTLLLGTMKIATLNIFQSMCRKDTESRSVGEGDTLKQLEMIQQYVQDLCDVCEEASRNYPGK
ncbi:coiled-coil domain-containing protein 42 [Pseudophryne corroboree]|uniref:coiled-coil domain-containing protein 42 n=1 Tax=Pseudophryne corroboree TaxID=495146 RepID=UPI0030817C3F